jgi:lipopolysaccharide export system permease protein
MPLLWRYLLKQFTKVFALCLVSFVAILLITRSQDIAKFATINHDLKPILLFALYQIPYILPLAIPISCLISTMILFQNLSQSQELTSMRASGISLKLLMAPIFLCVSLFALLNLCLASEIAPKCRILSKKALFQTA